MAETFIDCGMPLEKQLEYNLPEEKKISQLFHILRLLHVSVCVRGIVNTV